MAQILLVDDEEAILRSLRPVLEEAGHHVLTAPNGLAGMKLYNEYLFDLVIMDLVMPEQEGIQTIREIRQKSAVTRILAISGGGRHSFYNYLELALQLGADAALPKPFTQDELLEAVNSLLNRDTTDSVK